MTSEVYLWLAGNPPVNQAVQEVELLVASGISSGNPRIDTVFAQQLWLRRGQTQ